jgi:uncharacterized membrane protein
MDIIERADSVRVTWKMAADKGYVQQAIIDYTVPEFSQFISALLPGVLMAMAVPILGQMGGGIAGAVLGSLIGPEGTWAGAEIGQTLGLAAADLLLLKWGLEFIKDFILPQVGMVGTELGEGMEDAWNAGGWGTVARQRYQDAAAHRIAAGIGMLFGLLLMGLVQWLMKEPAKRIGKFQDSMLAKASPRITTWLENNLPKLQQRYLGGLTRATGASTPPRVITGTPALERAQQRWGPQAQALGIADYEAHVLESELPPGTALELESTRQTAMKVIPSLIDHGGKVIPSSLAQMDAILTKAGFRLIRIEDYGPDEGGTGFQLFYRSGKVLVRYKTTGENGGPRKGKPHLSVGYFDGAGMDFRNDKAKFTSDGTVVAKTKAPLRDAKRKSAPVQWTLLTADFSKEMMDAWARRCHFNAPDNFDLAGLEVIVRRVRPGWHRPPVIAPISTGHKDKH